MLVRLAIVAGAFLIGREIGIGFRRGLVLKSYEMQTKAAEIAATLDRASRDGRYPFRMYETTEQFAQVFNVAYGSLVRSGKEHGAIPEDHPESLPFGRLPIVRSNGINGVMRRGAGGMFEWVDPRKLDA